MNIIRAKLTALSAAGLLSLTVAGTAQAGHGDFCDIAINNGLNVIYALPGMETVGTDGDDVIIGTEGDDVINGGEGNDTICGLGGSDTISGGNGQDSILGDVGCAGGCGNGSVNGTFDNAGADVLSGGNGKDTLWGDGGDDMIAAGNGKDTLIGGPALADEAADNDVCDGGRGKNRFVACEIAQ